MNEQLDIAKILKDIKTTKILMEHSFGNEAIINKINHTENNLIDLEEILSDSESHHTELSSENYNNFESQMEMESPNTMKTYEGLITS